MIAITGIILVGKHRCVDSFLMNSVNKTILADLRKGKGVSFPLENSWRRCRCRTFSAAVILTAIPLSKLTRVMVKTHCSGCGPKTRLGIQ